MKLTRFQNIVLGIGGVTALGVGLSILAVPHAFYAGYGIGPGTGPDLLSELRAPGAGLAALGAVMLGGILRRAPAPVAVAVALIVYLAFPAGRLVGLLVDGVPSAGILAALAIELAIAAACLVAFAGPSRSGASSVGGARVSAS